MEHLCFRSTWGSWISALAGCSDCSNLNAKQVDRLSELEREASGVSVAIGLSTATGSGLFPRTSPPSRVLEPPFSAQQSDVVRRASTQSEPNPHDKPFADVPLDELLESLYHVSDAVVAKYRRAVKDRRADPEQLRRAETSIRRCQQQLRLAQHLTVRQTWQGGEGAHFLSMYTGKEPAYRNFHEIARKVLIETRVVRHWKSQLPKQKVPVPYDLLAELPSSPTGTALDVDSWDGVDVFQLDKDCQQPLLRAFLACWRRQGLDRLCGAPPEKVADFMLAIEAAYRQNPYHNRIHAADVTLSSYYLWTRLAQQECLQSYFTEVDLLVLLVAAAVHDVAHPAVNNDFLVKTRHSLALRYNDRSPLENFHAATAFEMMKDMGVDLLQHSMPSPPVAPLRLRVIDMVLATDMAQHQRLVEDLAAEVGSQQSLQDIDKLVLEKHLVHMSDIGHPLRPRNLHLQWSQRVTEEFFAQGDQEKALGLVPLALFDREKAPSQAKGQTGFLNFVVLPAWTQLRAVLGAAGDEPQRCLSENLARWEDLAQLEQEPVVEPGKALL